MFNTIISVVSYGLLVLVVIISVTAATKTVKDDFVGEFAKRFLNNFLEHGKKVFDFIKGLKK